MFDKLVSVIVPVHNQEKYIGRCLRSLISQSLERKKYEIIVVNDCSTDKTSYALDLFKEEIILINNKKKLGLPSSLNKALKKTKTKFFIRVDSDDYVNFKFLEFMCLYLSENKEFDALCCDYYLVNDIEEIISRKNGLDEKIACGILFQTDQIINIGSYNEDFLYHEDKELMKRFVKKYKLERLKLPLYRYRRHNTNMTNDKNKMKYFKEILNKNE